MEPIAPQPITAIFIRMLLGSGRQFGYQFG
jgi:hypothetical protein